MSVLEDSREAFAATVPTQSFADLIVCMGKFTSRVAMMEQQNEILEGACKKLHEKLKGSTDLRTAALYKKQLDELGEAPAYDAEAFEHFELSIKLVGDEINKRWARLEVLAL